LEQSQVRHSPARVTFWRRLYAEQFCNYWRFLFLAWYASFKASSRPPDLSIARTTSVCLSAASDAKTLGITDEAARGVRDAHIATERRAICPSRTSRKQSLDAARSTLPWKCFSVTGKLKDSPSAARIRMPPTRAENPQRGRATHGARWHTGRFFMIQDERAQVDGPFDT
jgi:hypothetical protein